METVPILVIDANENYIEDEKRMIELFEKIKNFTVNIYLQNMNNK